ncbi:pre-mRNA cleavage complex II protein Clp1 [Metarhizium rileyi]|uniref:Kinase n=1 Tax=Metarhizium rileyi (strain RCEF 4871) TaxID=1649241 RepID=A0A162J361_METRR|nr:pre-mRNA cleavage complex II protein Clp1 [Metarhizium rileyi RCEF 4871]TWU77296.1 hypothetical protein ED733_004311 [Metarhizium rileyi]
MPQARRIPHVGDLQDYNHAVAGHAGTLCDSEGMLFCKPCTETELRFYEETLIKHPELARHMPEFIGSLRLQTPGNPNIGETVAGLALKDGSQAETEAIIESVTEELVNASRELQPEDNTTWVPSQGNKIKTDKAAVLENLTYSYTRPNVLDVKLGRRLYADDAPLEKKRRLEQISLETTHHKYSFRIAGMRTFRGSEDASELDDEEYKIYDKEYGRTTVNEHNVVHALWRFVFNPGAGIDIPTAQTVCRCFAKALDALIKVLKNIEIRMYSASILFVFEGDGNTLQDALRRQQACADGRLSPPATKRIDSGIGLDDGDVKPEAEPQQVITAKLIDFAHAEHTPGQGPDENVINGLQSLKDMFEHMGKRNMAN